MTIVPDLAVEVISRNDRAYEVSEKVQEYFAAGFPAVWTVDPVARTVTVYTTNSNPFTFSKGDSIEAPNALPGFSCKVADLFPAE